MPTATPPSPTVRALLARRELDLRLATPIDDASLDAPVRWVHSSDLADPTPFLSEDVVLLTTGTQFTGIADAEADAESDADAHAYVHRLRARGVRGLGFGTEVVRDGIPESLRLACAAAGMPLFEVPYRTPFIAVARAAAEAIAAQAYARRSWALDAQRALAIAALRPDGFDATLAELARQLGAWVGLYDASGTLTHAHAAAGFSADEELRSAVDAEAAAVLRRGGGTGAALRLVGRPVTLQTLGSGGQRGVLATAGAELDQDARAVVNAVVATTGLALEQRRMTAGAWSRLRAALVDLIASGHPELARHVATDAWGGFPSAPYVVAVADALAPTGAREVLDHHAAAGRLFYGRDDDGVFLLVAAADRPLLVDIAARLSWRLGTAAAAADDDVPTGRDRARLARDRGRPGSVTDVAEAPGDLLDDLATASARARAGAELTPLRSHDARHGTALEATLVAWLDNDGAHEATARVLGVHRHTVRTRIALSQRLLGRDLSTFADRAAIWTALRLSP